MQDESWHFWSLRPAGSDRTLDTKRPADLQLFTSGGLPTVMVKRCEECVTDVKVEVVDVVVVVVVVVVAVAVAVVLVMLMSVHSCKTIVVKKWLQLQHVDMFDIFWIYFLHKTGYYDGTLLKAMNQWFDHRSHDLNSSQCSTYITWSYKDGLFSLWHVSIFSFHIHV